MRGTWRSKGGHVLISHMNTTGGPASGDTHVSTGFRERSVIGDPEKVRVGTMT